MRRVALLSVLFAGCVSGTPTPPAPVVTDPQVVALPSGEVLACEAVSACERGLELRRCGYNLEDLGCVRGARDLGPYSEWEGGIDR